MAAHNELGRMGEDMAVTYLEKQGYAILERNNRLHHWEVDIIALKDGEVVFVEVKTRMSETFQRAEEAVDMRKARRMIVMADKYMKSHNRKETVRFDIIAVVREGDGFTLRHTQEAFNVFTVPPARGLGAYRKSPPNGWLH